MEGAHAVHKVSFDEGAPDIAFAKVVGEYDAIGGGGVGGKGLPRLPWPSMRPGVIGYSRRILLPSTTRQPAAFSAESICSAMVSAAFI